MSARASCKLPSRAALLGADFSWSCNLSLSPQAVSNWPFRCATSSRWPLDSCCRMSWAVCAAASCSCSSLTSSICNTEGIFAKAPAWKGRLSVLGHNIESTATLNCLKMHAVFRCTQHSRHDENLVANLLLRLFTVARAHHCQSQRPRHTAQ